MNMFLQKKTLFEHLKALVFLYAFKESVDCHLLSSFCNDSNLHISLFKYVLSTMGVSKELISKFLKNFADRFLAYTHRGKYIFEHLDTTHFQQLLLLQN